MIINYTESCTPDPESVQEGLRIYRESILKLVIEEWERRHRVRVDSINRKGDEE